jgi:hypothetical protein
MSSFRFMRSLGQQHGKLLRKIKWKKLPRRESKYGFFGIRANKETIISRKRVSLCFCSFHAIKQHSQIWEDSAEESRENKSGIYPRTVTQLVRQRLAQLTDWPALRQQVPHLFTYLATLLPQPSTVVFLFAYSQIYFSNFVLGVYFKLYTVYNLHLK